MKKKKLRKIKPARIRKEKSLDWVKSTSINGPLAKASLEQLQKLYDYAGIVRKIMKATVPALMRPLAFLKKTAGQGDAHAFKAFRKFGTYTTGNKAPFHFAILG